MAITYDEFTTKDELEQLRIIGDDLNQVTNPADVFGRDADKATAKKRFRKLSKVVHPDSRVGDADDDLAGVAFTRLNKLWESAQEAFEAGNYGEFVMADDANLGEVDVRGATYTIKHLMRSGDIGDYYLTLDADGNEYILHMARNAKNNDLMQNERNVLGRISASPAFEEFDGRRYVPEVVTHFMTPDGVACNLLKIANHGDEAPLPSLSEMHSLSEIADQLGDDLDIRHLGWMWRRLLGALTISQYVGVIHAGITPDSIWISTSPSNHGAVLMNWVHASTGQKPVKSVSSRWRSLYPAEVLAKMPPVPSTDFYMGGYAMQHAFSHVVKPNVNGNALDRYFYVMTQPVASTRLNDVADVGEAFSEAIFDGMGWKREFVVLDFQPAVTVDWSWWW